MTAALSAGGASNRMVNAMTLSVIAVWLEDSSGENQHKSIVGTE
jgi:hypothetical protein